MDLQDSKIYHCQPRDSKVEENDPDDPEAPSEGDSDRTLKDDDCSTGGEVDTTLVVAEPEPELGL